MRFQQRRQNKIIRRPFPARFIGVCRSSRDPDQRLLGKRVQRFAASTILNGEQPELLVIQPARVRRHPATAGLGATNFARQKEN